MWLQIIAFADAPVAGADVRVSVHGRLLVEAKAATNSRGVFPAPIWRPWLLDEEEAGDKKAPEPGRRRGRSLVRISISGGTISSDPFLGHLSADIAVTDPEHQILVVNPVTTLISYILEERPGLKLDDAERVVRKFLKLPPNYSLGLALGKSSHYVSPFFSPVSFMTEARDAGGLDALEHLLLQELRSPPVTHPFRPPHLLGSTNSSDAISAIQAGLYAGLLDVAGAENVSNLAGWALSFAGLPVPGASSDDIQTLQDALQGLVQEVSNLSSQVAQLTLVVQAKATQTLYNIITTQAQTLATDVNDMENRLYFLSQDCPPQPAGTAPTVPAPGTFCATEPQAIFIALSNEPIYSAYSNVQNYVQDNGTLGTEGMIHLYSLWLGQSKQFFREADSTQMQNLFDYWDGVLTQAAELEVELLHQEGEQNSGATQLMALMGNPDASPPTTGTFQANEAANLKLMFPAVPNGTVINTTDHLMWSLVPWTGSNPFEPAPKCAGFIGPQIASESYELSPYAGFNNWAQSPNKTQWQNAVQNATINASTPNWMTWLIQQTQTTGTEMPASPGFFNWTTCSNLTHPYAWANTLEGDSNGYNVWWYINPINDTFGSTTAGSNFTDFPVRGLAAGEQYYWYQ